MKAAPRSALASGRRRGAELDPSWFALPLAILLAGMFIAPTIWFFVTTLSGLGGSVAEIADTVWSVLSSPVIRETIILTNWIAIVVSVVSLIAAYPVAYMMSRSSGLGLILLLLCVVLPYFTSVIVRTYSWMVILGRQGILNQMLLKLGLTEQPVALMYNTSAVIVGMAYVLMPYLVLTLYATMKQIDGNLIKAARGLGASGFYTFWRIYLPLTMPGVLSGSLIVFILALGFFITPALMGGPDDMMIAMLIEREVELTLNWPLAAIISLFLLALTLILYALYCRFADIERMMG